MSITLRPFRMDDLDQLVLHANNPLIAKNLTDQFPHPYTRTHGKKFLKMVSTHNPTQVFAIEYRGILCGAIGIHPQNDIMRKNAELGYWIAQPFWGKSIASQAVKKMVGYGFDNFDIHRIFARPYGPNKASQRVLEKAGFELEAILKGTIIKNDEILDELIYAIRK